MLNKIAGLALAGLVLAAPSAQAVRIIDTPFLSLNLTEAKYTVEMTLLSDSDGVTRIAMDGLAPLPVSVQSSGGAVQRNSDVNWALFESTVRDGYRITSITLTGTVTGSTALAPPDANCAGCVVTPGRAENYVQFANTIWGSGPRPVGSIHNVNGVENLSFTDQVSLYGSPMFAVNAFISAEALATRQTLGGSVEYFPAAASISLSDLVMTITVAPAVPEPATYGMLLGGLGVLGMLARRRKA